jgi:hypothetical protein
MCRETEKAKIKPHDLSLPIHAVLVVYVLFFLEKTHKSFESSFGIPR